MEKRYPASTAYVPVARLRQSRRRFTRPLLPLAAVTWGCAFQATSQNRSTFLFLISIVVMTTLGYLLVIKSPFIVAFSLFIAVWFIGYYFIATVPQITAANGLTGTSVWVEGRIVTFFNPDRDDGSRESMVVQMDNNVRIRVAVFSGHLQYGDRIRLFLQLSTPDPVRNPGGFDEWSWTSGQGVLLVGETQGDARARVLDSEEKWHPMRMAWAFRIHCYRSFLHQTSRENADILSALLFGDQSGLDDQLREDFRDAGLSHILSVSGSHLSMIAAPIQMMIGMSGPGKKWRLMLQFVFLLAFSAATGFQPCVLRALGMTMAGQCGKTLKRLPDGYSSLGACVAVLLVIQPWLSRNAGFFISVSAAAGILAWTPIVKSDKRGILRSLRMPAAVALAAQAGTLPAILPRYRRIPLLFLPVGVIVMPLFSILLPLGLILGIAGQMGKPGMMAGFADILIRVVVIVVSRAAAADGLRPLIPYWSPAAGAAIWLSVAAVVARGRKARIRLSAAAAVAVVLFFAQWGLDRLNRPDLTILFADVGQGDCTLLLTDDGTSVLIDSGTVEAGRKVVTPMLENLGIGHLDLCIATHGHADHAGGFLDVLERNGTDTLCIARTVETQPISDEKDEDLSARLIDVAEEKGVDMVQLRSESEIGIGTKTRLTILYPGTDPVPGNEGSLVILITCGGFRILVTGDAGLPSEKAMEDAGLLMDCDILRVGHHGSDGSTGEDFLDRVKPELAVISVGRNTYGHPANSLLDRLEAQGSTVLRTDRDGAVTIRIGQDRLRMDKALGGQPD